MATYAPGQTYRLHLLFTDADGVPTAPDAQPTVYFWRNSTPVNLGGVTHTDLTAGRWVVSLTVPNWTDGDTVFLTLAAAVGGLAVAATDSFVIRAGTTLTVVGAAVTTSQTVADGGITAAVYRGQAWTAVATLTQDATGLALAMRFYTETAVLPLELTNPTIAGAQATFAATGVQAATLPPGYVEARVYRTDVSPAVRLWAGKVPVN